MDPIMERILAGQERIEARLNGVDITLTKQHMSLDEHMRRTLAAEEMLAAVRLELAPVKTHVAVIGAIAKVLVALIGMAGAVAGIYRIFH